MAQGNWTVRFGRVAATAALALALAGCGDTPLQPTADLGGSSPSAPPAGVQLMTVDPDGSVGFETASSGTTSGEAQAAGPVATGGNDNLSTTAEVLGRTGGSVTCGRFTVTFPRNAFRGTGTVTMRVNDPRLMVVDLNITPGSLNGFKNPVALTFDPTGLDVFEPITIYWFDPNTKSWVDLVATPDAFGRPTVYLKHFSVYGAGKAGW
jgi:hypothetical protein